MVDPGMPEGLFIALQTILRPGNEVLPPSPYYGHQAIDTIACGGRPVDTIGSSSISFCIRPCGRNRGPGSDGLPSKAAGSQPDHEPSKDLEPAAAGSDGGTAV